MGRMKDETLLRSYVKPKASLILNSCLIWKEAPLSLIFAQGVTEDSQY